MKDLRHSILALRSEAQEYDEQKPRINLPLATLLMKRGIDLSGAVILLLLTAPLMAMIALMIALDGGPIFFAHQRIGKHGAAFGCLKFRTMILDAESCLEEYLDHHPEQKHEWLSTQKLTLDPRITAIGKILRATSLDELPQLINIIRGDMSLVGPRPVTSDELQRYGQKMSHYLAVRPGLTGPWQISGRSNVSYDDRVTIDHHYVSHLSIFTDVAILIKTPQAVLYRKGAR